MDEEWGQTGMPWGAVGYPMSPTLFQYLCYLEEELRKEQTEGTVIGKEKMWSISYVDDMVVTASEQKLKGMMKRFKKYIERKRLVLKNQVQKNQKY